MPATRGNRGAAGNRITDALLAAALAGAVLLAGCAPDPDPDVLRPEDTEVAMPNPEGFEPDPAYQRPEAGTCLRIKPAEVTANEVVGSAAPCGQNHNAQVVAAPMLPEGLDWSLSQQELQRLAARDCATAFARRVGGGPRERARSVMRLLVFQPTAEQRERGARWFRCDVAAMTDTGRMVRLPQQRSGLLGKQGSGVPDRYLHCRQQGGRSVTCDKPHAFRVAQVIDIAPKDPLASYPPQQRFRRVAERRCPEALGTSYYAWRYPTPLQWRADGLVPLLCFRAD